MSQIVNYVTLQARLLTLKGSTSYTAFADICFYRSIAYKVRLLGK
jgi:hypothetical protein